MLTEGGAFAAAVVFATGAGGVAGGEALDATGGWLASDSATSGAGGSDEAGVVAASLACESGAGDAPLAAPRSGLVRATANWRGPPLRAP